VSVFETGNGKVQISEAHIKERIRLLGQQIEQDYKGQEPHLVCVLNGAFVFMADLVRAIDMPVTMDFLAVSSYGNSTKTSGEVELLKDLRLPISGRHVIIVEDIVDTGITLNYLLKLLEARQPASLKVAALLSKPSRRKTQVPVAYLGFEIDDAFVYGYGLDRAQLDRNIPFVTSV
jgi:hypoxanthine phosphoribosyltransferase